MDGRPCEDDVLPLKILQLRLPQTSGGVDLKIGLERLLSLLNDRGKLLSGAQAGDGGELSRKER